MHRERQCLTSYVGAPVIFTWFSMFPFRIFVGQDFSQGFCANLLRKWNQRCNTDIRRERNIELKLLTLSIS